MASVKDGVMDYSTCVVGIKNALKALEEKLLVAETNSTMQTQDAVLKEILKIQMHNEHLELITLRKIGEFKKGSEFY